jgi:hypothetical protein
MKYTYVPGQVNLAIFPEYKNAPLTGSGRASGSSIGGKGFDDNPMFARDRKIVENAQYGVLRLEGKDNLTDDDIRELIEYKSILNSQSTLSHIFQKTIEIASKNANNVALVDGEALIDRNTNRAYTVQEIADKASRYANIDPEFASSTIASSVTDSKESTSQILLNELGKVKGYNSEEVLKGNSIKINGVDVTVISETSKDNIEQLGKFKQLVESDLNGTTLNKALLNDYYWDGNMLSHSTVDENGKYIPGQEYKIRYFDVADEKIRKNIPGKVLEKISSSKEPYRIQNYTDKTIDIYYDGKEMDLKAVNETLATEQYLVKATTKDDEIYYFRPYTVEDYKLGLASIIDVNLVNEGSFNVITNKDGDGKDNDEYNPYATSINIGNTSLIQNVYGESLNEEIGKFKIPLGNTKYETDYSNLKKIISYDKEDMINFINNYINKSGFVSKDHMFIKDGLNSIALNYGYNLSNQKPDMIKNNIKFLKEIKDNIDAIYDQGNMPMSEQLFNVNQNVERLLYTPDAIKGMIGSQNDQLLGVPYINNGKTFYLNTPGEIVGVEGAYRNVRLNHEGDESPHRIIFMKFKLNDSQFKDFLMKNKKLMLTAKTGEGKELIDKNGKLTDLGEKIFKYSNDGENKLHYLSLPSVSDANESAYTNFTGAVGSHYTNRDSNNN